MSNKVSIVIPSYNDGEKLIQLLSSIANQTYSNIEVILIDGGSTDQTETVVKKYGSLINYFISEPDKGIFDAMNKGVQVAKGDWLFFIGCDDKFYDNNVLSNIFSHKDLHGIDVLYGKIYDKQKKTTLGQEIKSRKELLSSQFWHQSIFYNKSIFSTTGLYKIEYKIAADTIFNCDAFCNYDLKWKFTNEVTTIFSGDGLSSFTADKKFHLDQKEFYFIWFRDLPKKLIYDALQHHLYNEIKQGSILKAVKEFFTILWVTKKIQPYIHHSAYWLKYRLLSKQIH
jgi:glycosyltransferase involved in cell wall biosynthesis